MVDLGEIFGKGSIAEQFVLWQILAQFAEPILAPVLQTLQSASWVDDPNVPTPAPVLAALVNRGLIDDAYAKSEASKSGVGPDSFAQMVNAASAGPQLAEVMELWRRGVIDQGEVGQSGVSFAGALKDAGVRDEWVAALANLKLIKPDGPQALNAYLQGQIPEAEARRLWELAGWDPAFFTMMFNAEGTAPTPDMAGTMANRGIIPWEGDGPESVSFHQAFLEGPWRNKWAAPMRALMEYLPPARTVTAMVRAGSITDAQALELWRKEGLSAELAAAYLADAHHGKAAAAKELSQSQIITLYRDHKIDRARALRLLESLRYSAANAGLLLDLADVAKADSHVNAAITRVRSLYVAHKITRPAAAAALGDLHLPDAQRSELLALWDLETSVNVKQLTEAQIVAAWGNKVLSQDEAQTELGHLGYTPFDAWVLLSNYNRGPLPGRPAQGPGPGVNP